MTSLCFRFAVCGEGSIVCASGVDADKKEGRVVEKYDVAVIGIVISWLMEAY